MIRIVQNCTIIKCLDIYIVLCCVLLLLYCSVCSYLVYNHSGTAFYITVYEIKHISCFCKFLVFLQQEILKSVPIGFAVPVCLAKCNNLGTDR
jgi:hypothetical protein